MARRRRVAKPPPEREDELDVFRLRAEWFRELNADATGRVPSRAREQALGHARLLGRVRLAELDPGGTRPARGHQLIAARGSKARARKGKNPRPKSSFGFAAAPVDVRGPGAIRGSVLKVALDRESLEELDPATVRLFRFEDSADEWHLIARSGSSLEGEYAWGQLHRPGLYAPIGLPRNQWVLATLLVIDSYMPWLNAARELGRLPDAIDRICRLILCDGLFDELAGDPKRAGAVGLPPIDPRSLENVCERCLGLDLPVGGLPELEILADPSAIVDLPPIILVPFWCPRWVSAGPTNFSGRIKSLAIHPTDGNVVYAGAADGGVWKTTNGGATWVSQMRLELSFAIGAIAVAPSSPSIVYAATGENTPGWGPSYPGVGVYKSTDEGGDWDLMAPIASSRCTRVLVHPTNPDVVYVAGNAGLHKSTDGGASWTNIRTDHVSDALLDPLTPSTLYAGVWNSGIYKSTDAGATWTQLTNGVPTGSNADWIKLAMGLNGTDGTAFLLAKMGTDSGLLYRSRNAGASWTQLPGTHHPASYNEWTSMVAVDPENQNVLLAGGIGVSRSTNGGTSFTAIGGTHADHHQIVFSPTDSDVCYMSTDGGVYRSTNNGASWTLASSGLIATQLYSMGASQTSALLLGAGTQDQGIIRSDGSAAWTDTGAGNEGGFFIVDPNDSDNVYTTPWSTNLRRSTNGGTSWTTILNGLGSPAVGVRDLAVKHGDSNLLLCVGADKIFRSTNQGSNWTQVQQVTGQAMQVAFSPSSPSVAYVATNDGRVYRSSGSGASGSWSEPYTAANKPPAGTIYALVVGWTDANLVYIGYAGYGTATVYRTEDGGVHWSNAGGVLATDALPDIPVSSLAIHPYNPEAVYAATAVGVFRTLDGGDSWEPFDEGMPRIVTTELSLRKLTKTLYVSTMGRGAFRRTL